MSKAITFYTKAILLMVCMLLMPFGVRAQEAWVEYLSGTLTFHYDNNRSRSNNANNFSLPEAGEKPGWFDLREQVTKVVFDKKFSQARPQRCAMWFYGQIKLTEIEGLENLNTSEVDDMSNMFAYCKSLTTLDLSSFNTTHVTTMRRMFDSCWLLTSLDVSSFNTSNVDDMSSMFRDCSHLVTLDLTSFNTRKVTTMREMFAYDERLTSITVYSYFVTDQVTDSEHMFYNCEKLPYYNFYIDVADHYDASNTRRYMTNLASQVWVEYQDSTKTLRFRNDHLKDSIQATAKYALPENGAQPGWYGTQVEHVVFDSHFAYSIPQSCALWFAYQKNLTDITGIENLNTSEVTDMSNMFISCESLTSLDLSSLQTDSVTTMSYMFDGCTALTEVDLSSFNTEKVTDMSYMFNGCSNLPTLDLTSFNTKKVTNMKFMFTKDEQLTKVLVSSRFATDQVSQSDLMFQGCVNLPSFVADSVDKTKAKDYLTYLPSFAWVEYQSVSKTLTFHYDDLKPYTTATSKYDLPEANVDPEWKSKEIEHVKIDEHFKDARPVSCARWFHELSNLTDIIGLEYLNTSEVTDMSYMFAYCSSLSELDLSHFNTANVTTMSHMFEYCLALTLPDLSSFNTQNVEDMSNMFDCCHFTEMDLTNFETQKVKNMRGMFFTCVKLKKVTVSSRFVTDQVTSSELMFFGCDQLPGFVSDSVDKEKAKDYLTYLPYYPWVEYQAETNSLRFRYDDLKSFVTATAKYDLPTTGEPGWLKHEDVDRVTIDPSFSQARPVTCNAWFLAQRKITEIEGLQYLCTDSVTNMANMFRMCYKLKQLDLSHFNTEHVTTMSCMFYLCQSLTDVQVRSFNTEKVTDMSYMFLDCRNLKELDLTSFNTKNVTTMNEMFDMISDETSLEHIYVSEQFVADQLLKNYGMFYSCSKLPNYTWGKFDKEVAHYNEAEGGYLTLRRQFSVGDSLYNVDGYAYPTCYTDVDFTEGALYNAAFDFTFAPNNYATYTRKVSNHWATLCLPFAFSAADDSSSRFYGIESYTEGNITVKQLTDTIPAGTPVLAYVTGDELNVSAIGTAVVTAPATSDVLQGTFTEKEIDNEDYIIANDHFWNVFWLKMENGKCNHVYIAPYRAYLTLDAIDNPYYISIIDDVVTGVTDPTGAFDSLRQEADLSAFIDGAELYDLQGRRLTAPQRGMMIVRKNGVSRKVIIK